MTRKTLLLIALLGAIGGIHLATLREGQEWGDDFGLYVAHARNLAEGRSYADTGYVYNPANSVLSPRTYPPIFPLLLAPIYLVFGMNLTAMKVFVVLLFLAMLGVLGLLFQRRAPFPYVLGCLTLFALNPYVWQHKDRLLSETPFMLFAYLSLLWAEKAQEETGRRRAAIWGLLAGMAAYLAFGTRTVGIVLVPSVLLSDWLWRRRLSTATASFAAAFLAGVAAQKCLLVIEGSYLDQLVFDPALFARIALSLARALGNFLENGYSNAARLILFACLLAPACWAYLTRMRQHWNACELFALFNGLVLVLWPAAEYDRRFLLPILPLFFLWAAEGLHRLESTSLRRLERPAGMALALAVLLSYAGWYSRMDVGPIRNGVGSPEAAALFDWVQKQTDGRDVFLFPRPRAFALFTGRHALAHHPADNPPALARTLTKHGVTHLVVYHSSPFPIFQKSGRLVEALIADNPSGFDTVYENRGFRVYHIREGSLASR
ncbi:MAG: hypothetical protein ACYC3I_19640 [Gemmataceae bacterium]